MKRLQTFALAASFGAYMLYGVWFMFFRVTNEIGPVGADKLGRSVYLYSLNEYFSRFDSSRTGYSVRIGSAPESKWIVVRMVKRSMKTTFRMSYRIGDTVEIDSTFVERLLDSDADEFLSLYRGPAEIRENVEIPPDALRARMSRLKVATFADFLAAFGFRRFEVLVNGTPFMSKDLPQVGRGNIKWIGLD